MTSDLPAKVPGTQSIQRTAHILRELSCSAGLRLSDIATRTGLEAPTAHRMLKRLVMEGLVAQRRDTKTYSLGPLIYELGLAAATRYDVREACAETLKNLANATGDTIFLNVRSGNDAVCIGREEGWYPVKTLLYEIGSRRPLGVGAGGQALLLSLSEEVAEATMAANAPRISGHGRLTPDIVLQMYKTARTVGYGVSRELAVSGTSAVAMPVQIGDGAVYAAISIVAITERMTEARIPELAKLLREQIVKLETKFSQRDQLNDMLDRAE